MTSQRPRVLLVAGEVTYEYMVYPTASREQSDALQQSEGDEVAQLVIRTGAADLVARILNAAAPQWSFQVLGPKLEQPAANSLRNNASSVIDLSPRNTVPSTTLSYSVIRNRLIDKRPVWHSPEIEQAALAKASTVIISGSGEAFKDVEPALDFIQRVKPRYIVHHMTRPLATGALWDIIRDGPRTRDGIPDPDYLAVIVDADDLRAEGISLSRSLSWEATAEDFVRNLGSNGQLDTLVTCPNLVVRFGNEAVIHHRGRDATNPKLYFNTRRTEADSRNTSGKHMIGLASAFTAGFALGFADSSPPDGNKAIRMGISASCLMEETGFVTNSSDEAPDYPIEKITRGLEADRSFGVVSIPSARISLGDSWNIFDLMTGDPAEVARQIVTFGVETALKRCTVHKIGDLLSVEKKEQETLHAVLDAAQVRIASQQPEPTSFSIIGPLGSGKKFVASNIAKHFSTSQDIKLLTYNAHLLKLDGLPAICNEIMNFNARRFLTVVCFENFEVIMNSNKELLSPFLTLIRDGSFNDNGHTRKLGHTLFFFLVNQAPSTDDTLLTTAADSASHAEVDSLISLPQLHGIIRIKGPNQVNSDDKMFPIRRAIMLRHMLLKKFPHLEVKGTIKVDEAVLRALLLVPAYKDGLRSLDVILSICKLSNRNRTEFDIWALPPEEQIQLHVDGSDFMSYLRSPKLQAALREKLAQGLFIAYKIQRLKMAKTEAEKQKLESDRAMYDWDELAGELKESTRAQADDIPRKLRSVKCFMLQDKDRKEPLIPVTEFSKTELDELSEMEHQRFNAERLQKQWRIGGRNSGQRTTPFLIPYRDLEQDWKDVDRVMVECVPRLLAAEGWTIYRMQEES